MSNIVVDRDPGVKNQPSASISSKITITNCMSLAHSQGYSPKTYSVVDYPGQTTALVDVMQIIETCYPSQGSHSRPALSRIWTPRQGEELRPTTGSDVALAMRCPWFLQFSPSDSAIDSSRTSKTTNPQIVGLLGFRKQSLYMSVRNQSNIYMQSCSRNLTIPASLVSN